MNISFAFIHFKNSANIISKKKTSPKHNFPKALFFLQPICQRSSNPPLAESGVEFRNALAFLFPKNLHTLDKLHNLYWTENNTEEVNSGDILFILNIFKNFFKVLLHFIIIIDIFFNL